MSRMFYPILPFLIFAGEAIRDLEMMIESSPTAPFSVKYSRTIPETNYTNRNLLPLNTPRGDNIGVHNFKKI